MFEIPTCGAIIIEGHVQGLANTRALGREGIPVVVIDKEKKCLARYSKYCIAFHQCPDYQSDKLADFLIELAKKDGLQNWVVLPSNDHAVYTLARNKYRLSDYLGIITESIETIEKIINKDRFLVMADSVGVPIPKTWYLSGPEDQQIADLSYPVLTKGRNGLTFFKKYHRKAFLAENDIQLRRQLEEINTQVAVSETFTQEVIPDDGNNKTESFTAFSIDGEIKAHWTGVKLREHPLRFGTATFAKSIDGGHLLPYGQKILRELKFTGVCEIEFLKDPRDNKYKLIEMNARTWLWVGLAVACGINYPILVYQYVKRGRNIHFPIDYKKNEYWRNFLVDFYYSVLPSLIKGKFMGSIFQKKSKAKAVFSLNDFLPSIRYFFMLYHIKKTRG